MGKGYVPVFHDWLEVTEELNAEEKGRLIDAIVLYARGDDYSGRIQGNERFLFPAFKQQIDRSAEISEARSKAGGTRREPEAKPPMAVLNISNPLQTVTTPSKPEQTEANRSKAEQKKFRKPTVEEVRDYCRERGNNVDAQTFIDFYESKGWRVGNQPMKDWKAAVRTWEKRETFSHSSGKSSGKKDWSHYEGQRSYEGLDEIMMQNFVQMCQEEQEKQKREELGQA